MIGLAPLIFIPFFALLVWGIVTGVWVLVSGREPATLDGVEAGLRASNPRKLASYREYSDAMRIVVKNQRRVAVPRDQNKAVARRVLDDLVTQGNLDVVDQIYAPNFELVDPTSDLVITTHEGVKDLTRALRAQSPDLSVTIEEEIAEGDAVVHRWTARGLNPRTGEVQQTPGISVYHLREGRIVSEFVIPDGRRNGP